MSYFGSPLHCDVRRKTVPSRNMLAPPSVLTQSHRSVFRLAQLLAYALCATLTPLVSAQAQATLPPSAHTPTGILLSNSTLTLRVDALRPDVLRVRMYPNTHPAQIPEDASWAVLPPARTASIAVTSEPDGFSTADLRVSVAPDLRLTISDLAGHILQSDALPVDWTPHGFTVTKAKPTNDHFFGLGDKPGPLDRAGEAFTMWNTDSFGWQESTDPIYKSIPFFLEMHDGRTLGVLFDNTYRTFFDLGRRDPSQYTFSAPSGPLDYYILYGPDPKQVVEAYAWLTGPTPLPPLWALGYQQSRYTYTPRAQVEEVATRLRRDKIPADGIWLDIDYQYKNRPFTVDPTTFPDFPGLIHNLAAEHLHTIVIADLHIADAPDQGYHPYDSGIAGDQFVKLNGKAYVGNVWPGPSLFPDFTQATTRTWFASLYKDFVNDGVAGFWDDMNEPAVFTYPTKTMPDDVAHRISGEEAEGFSPRTALHTEIHNVYGMENSRATMEGELTLRPNLRPYVMTRATYAGGQRYAVTWTGDNLATWNHLRMTTPQLLNLGLSGFSLAGADVGGFGGSPSPDLLTKWLMLAAFQPIDRDHAAKGTRPHEPWVDGPEQEDIRRRYINQRYLLMPYLYTTAEETSRTGIPIIRPLFLEYPHATADNHPLDSDAPGEFFFGPSILVAESPLPDDVAPYRVHLPPGVWYDYWTGAKLDRRETLTTHDLEIRDPTSKGKPHLPPLMVHPALGDLPIYVHAGAIIPLQPLVQSTDEKPNGPLTLRVYVPADGSASDCAGDLYTDDGLTFDFRHGAYLRLHLTCSMAPDGALTLNIPAREGDFHPWWTQFRIEAVGFTPHTSQASTNGHTVPLDHTDAGYAVTIPDTGRPQTIVLH
jgi:alpha-glucosidase